MDTSPKSLVIDKDRTSEYENLKQKLVDMESEVDIESDIDFSAMRWAYRYSAYYEAWDTKEHEASLAMFNAFEDENYSLCKQFASAILKKNYTSISGHLGSYNCSVATGNSDTANFHRFVLSGLAKSIEQSGDGLSPATAYVTITPTEMRSFIQMLGLTSFRQELTPTPGKYIERFYVIDMRTEEYKTLYFDNSASLLKQVAPTLPSLN